MTEHTPQPTAEEERRLAIGQAVLERVRERANGEFAYFAGDEDHDFFTDLYLTPRHTAIPEHLLGDSDELHRDVRSVFAQVFDGVRDELDLRMGRESLWVVIDPAFDDTTTTVLCTNSTILLIYGCKPWRFWWPNERTMADDLGGWYEVAANRLLAERQHQKQLYGTPKT